MPERASDRLLRMLGMVAYLDGHEDVAVDDLAAQFGVTPEQVIADVDTLWVTGTPGYLPYDLIDFDATAYEKGVVTLVEARGSIFRGLENVEYACGAPSLLFGDTLENLARNVDCETLLQPLGVCVGITPFNFPAMVPLWMFPLALVCGNTFVLKPSEKVPLSAVMLGQLLEQAGCPKGVFNIVNGRGDVVGAEFSTHPDIAKVSFTGSTAVGKQILRSGAETLKRVTLELGGKGPNIILDDADLDSAIPTVLMMGLANSGQACIAGTRILAPESRMAEILPRLKAGAEAIKTGDPSDPEVKVGPMVSQKQYDRVQSYIRLGEEEGAELLTGGPGRPEGLERGWLVRPTIFANVHNGMRIAREEIFGPVLSVIPYRDEEDAIRIANDTSYGLQAYVHSSDPARAKRVAEQMESGRVVINGAPHEPLAPFGGFKQSGIGREFGVFGLEAFLEPRAILA